MSACPTPYIPEARKALRQRLDDIGKLLDDARGAAAEIGDSRTMDRLWRIRNNVAETAAGVAS